MNSEEKRFFQVEAYLLGELPPEAAAAFEQEMAADPALSEQVAAHRAQQKVEEFLIEEDLRESVKTWKAEREAALPQRSQASGAKISWLPLWGVLSMAAALLALVYFFLVKPDESGNTPGAANQSEQPVANEDKPSSTPKEEPTMPPKTDAPKTQAPKSNIPKSPPATEYQALATRFEEVPKWSAEGLRNEEGEDILSQAVQSIEKKEFEKAETLLRQIKPADGRWLDAQYNLGCLFYLQKKYGQAVPFLRTAAENEEFLFADNARWYLTLCLLAAGKPADAKTHLDKILAEPRGDFFKKAQALKAEIEKE